MNLAKYRPLFPEFAAFPQFGEMPGRMQRIFDDFFAAPTATQFGWTPDVDIIEEEKELLLTAELPGMKKEDVQLEIAEGTLTLRGEKKVEKEKKEGTYRVFERSYGAFERSFVLPRSVDPNNIKADFEDGVLKIHLPKTEKAQGRRVEISAK